MTPENGGTVIKRDRVLKMTAPYYYQVQIQMFVTGLSFCDFVVWTKKGIFVASILFNKEFMTSLCKKVESFWYGQVFPVMVDESTNNDSAPNKAAGKRFCFLSLFSTKLQSLTLLLKQFSKKAYGPLRSHPFSMLRYLNTRDTHGCEGRYITKLSDATNNIGTEGRGHILKFIRLYSRV